MYFKNYQSKHHLYFIWQDMKRRCYNKNRPEYKDYGGRGIKVCSRWLKDFWNFVDDMGIKPNNKSLDRINNNGNYTTSNCKWSTRREQGLNRRDFKRELPKHIYKYKHRNTYRVVVTVNGKTKYLGSYKTIEAAKLNISIYKKEGVIE